MRRLLAEWVRTIGSKYKRANFPRRNRGEANRVGWDRYARGWDFMKKRAEIPGLKPTHCGGVQHIGDEWSLMEDTEFPYGLGVQSVDEFLDYIDENLLCPYLPSGNDLNIMEIGPGGGRITQLLLPRCKKLYAVDISREMLRSLQRRFKDEAKIKYILTDGAEITQVPIDSLDAVVTFDAFVHLEPWEIFRYLELTKRLFKRKGVGIIHFPDVETTIGFQLFRSQVSSVLKRGASFDTFSVMSKGIMQKFLNELGFEIISMTNDIVPRDAVAIFGQGGTF